MFHRLPSVTNRPLGASVHIESGPPLFCESDPEYHLSFSAGSKDSVEKTQRASASH